MRKEIFMKLRNKDVHRRIFVFFIFAFILTSLYLLSQLHYVSIPTGIMVILELFVVSLVCLLIATIVIRLTEHHLFNFLEREIEVEQRIFLSKVYSLFWYACAIAIILWKLGASLENITLSLGLITTGIAFAIRDIILSFFAWMIILSKKPFRIDDVIKVDNEIGKVVRIGTFLITLSSLKNRYQQIKIPNKVILEKPVTSMGKDKITYNLPIPLAQVPPNMQSKIQEVVDVIKKQGIEEELIKVNVQVGENGWFLNLSFVLSVKDEMKKDTILVETYQIMKDVVKKEAKK